jgi:hypothetical protein
MVLVSVCLTCFFDLTALPVVMAWKTTLSQPQAE